MSAKITKIKFEDVEFSIGDRVRRRMGRYHSEGIGRIVSIRTETIIRFEIDHIDEESKDTFLKIEVDWENYSSIFNIKSDDSVYPLIKVDAPNEMEDNPNSTFRKQKDIR